MAIAANYLGGWLHGHCCPVVLTLCSGEVERLCMKNGLLFHELLNAFSSVEGMNSNLRLPQQLARPISEMKLRFERSSECVNRCGRISINDMFLNALNAQEDEEEDGYGGFSQQPVGLDQVSWARRLCHIQMHAVNFSDFDMMSTPIAIVVVVASTDIDPAAAMQQLDSGAHSPACHISIDRYYILLHDNQESSDAAHRAISQLKIQFPRIRLLAINSEVSMPLSVSSLIGGRNPDIWKSCIPPIFAPDELPDDVLYQYSLLSQRSSSWNIVYDRNRPILDESKRVLNQQVEAILERGRGQFLSPEDLISIKQVVTDIARQAVLPSMERQINQLTASVSNARRGVRNVIKSWWRKPRDGLESDDVGGVSYRYDRLESQTRLLADLLFLIGDVDGALQNYKTVRDDFKADKAYMNYSCAVVMVAICQFVRIVSDFVGMGTSGQLLPPFSCARSVESASSPNASITTMSATTAARVREVEGNFDLATHACFNQIEELNRAMPSNSGGRLVDFVGNRRAVVDDKIRGVRRFVTHVALLAASICSMRLSGYRFPTVADYLFHAAERDPSSAMSAVLYEGVAHAWHRCKSDRKSSLFSIAAGQKYSESVAYLNLSEPIMIRGNDNNSITRVNGQQLSRVSKPIIRQHVVRSYFQAARSFEYLKSWRFALDHVHFTLGNQLSIMDLSSSSCQFYFRLFIAATQSIEYPLSSQSVLCQPVDRQAEFLNEAIGSCRRKPLLLNNLRPEWRNLSIIEQIRQAVSGDDSIASDSKTVSEVNELPLPTVDDVQVNLCSFRNAADGVIMAIKAILSGSNISDENMPMVAASMHILFPNGGDIVTEILSNRELRDDPSVSYDALEVEMKRDLIARLLLECVHQVKHSKRYHHESSVPISHISWSEACVLASDVIDQRLKGAAMSDKQNRTRINQQCQLFRKNSKSKLLSSVHQPPLHLLKSLCSEHPLMEPILISVPVRNPLAVKLHLSNLHLTAEMMIQDKDCRHLAEFRSQGRVSNPCVEDVSGVVGGSDCRTFIVKSCPINDANNHINHESPNSSLAASKRPAPVHLMPVTAILSDCLREMSCSTSKVSNAVHMTAMTLEGSRRCKTGPLFTGTEAFYVTDQDVVLEPNSTIVLVLCIQPRALGTLRVTGMRWCLQSSIWCSHKFDFKGKPLHDTLEQRATGVRGWDLRCTRQIMEEKPLLHIEMTKMPSKCFSGQILPLTLKLSNIGNSPATSIVVSSSETSFVACRKDATSDCQLHQLPFISPACSSFIAYDDRNHDYVTLDPGCSTEFQLFSLPNDKIGLELCKLVIMYSSLMSKQDSVANHSLSTHSISPAIGPVYSGFIALDDVRNDLSRYLFPAGCLPARILSYGMSSLLDQNPGQSCQCRAIGWCQKRNKCPSMSVESAIFPVDYCLPDLKQNSICLNGNDVVEISFTNKTRPTETLAIAQECKDIMPQIQLTGGSKADPFTIAQVSMLWNTNNKAIRQLTDEFPNAIDIDESVSLLMPSSISFSDPVCNSDSVLVFNEKKDLIFSTATQLLRTRIACASFPSIIAVSDSSLASAFCTIELYSLLSCVLIVKSVFRNCMDHVDDLLVVMRKEAEKSMPSSISSIRRQKAEQVIEAQRNNKALANQAMHVTPMSHTCVGSDNLRIEYRDRAIETNSLRWIPAPFPAWGQTERLCRTLCGTGLFCPLETSLLPRDGCASCDVSSLSLFSSNASLEIDVSPSAVDAVILEEEYIWRTIALLPSLSNQISFISCLWSTQASVAVNHAATISSSSSKPRIKHASYQKKRSAPPLPFSPGASIMTIAERSMLEESRSLSDSRADDDDDEAANDLVPSCKVIMEGMESNFKEVFRDWKHHVFGISEDVDILKSISDQLLVSVSTSFRHASFDFKSGQSCKLSIFVHFSWALPSCMLCNCSEWKSLIGFADPKVSPLRLCLVLDVNPSQSPAVIWKGDRQNSTLELTASDASRTIELEVIVDEPVVVEVISTIKLSIDLMSSVFPPSILQPLSQSMIVKKHLKSQSSSPLLLSVCPPGRELFVSVYQS